MDGFEIPWEQLGKFFGYRIPIGVFFLLVVIGMACYYFSSNNLRKGIKGLREVYSQQIEHLKKVHSDQMKQCGEEKERLTNRIENLERKLDNYI